MVRVTRLPAEMLVKATDLVSAICTCTSSAPSPSASAATWVIAVRVPAMSTAPTVTMALASPVSEMWQAEVGVPRQ